MESPTAVVILLGAGAGRRLAAREPKAFLSIGGRPILTVAATGAADSLRTGALVVTFPPGWEERARACLEDAVDVPLAFVPGGDSRQASVRAALAQLPEATELIVVHDAARPFASPDLFDRVVDAVADGADGAIPVVPVADTVVRLRGGAVAATESRDELALAQTPQAFQADVLREAHAKADAAGLSFTDDASVLTWAGFAVRTIPGDPANVKITTLADLAQADRRIGGDDD